MLSSKDAGRNRVTKYTQRRRVAHCEACGAMEERERLRHQEGCEALTPAALEPPDPRATAGGCPVCGGAWGEVHAQANACLAPGSFYTGNRFVKWAEVEEGKA